MNSTSFSVDEMRTSNGASVLFTGFHWILAIVEPSGNGWPLRGMPAL